MLAQVLEGGLISSFSYIDIVWKSEVAACDYFVHFSTTCFSVCIMHGELGHKPLVC